MRTILAENNTLLITSEFETTRCIDKLSGEILFEDEFYGDPECALISPDSSWVIVAGEHITVYNRREVLRLSGSNLDWIVSMRVKSAEIVEVLTDPYSHFSAIWEINTTNWLINKVRDFPDYYEKPFTENIQW